jgi:hypothetical protein
VGKSWKKSDRDKRVGFSRDVSIRRERRSADEALRRGDWDFVEMKRKDRR